MNKRKELCFHPVFLLSLALLALNDHVLKHHYHNALTGKLSDLAGLIVLPVFIALLTPRLAKWSCLIAALFFIFWKTEWSSGLIEQINANGFLTIGRVIDYSDFIALLILPLPWAMIREKTPIDQRLRSAGSIVILVVTSLTLMATSIRRNPVLNPEGTIRIAEKHPLKVPKDTVLSRIKHLGYTYEKSDQYYHIYDIVIPPIEEGQQFIVDQDTIKELTFSFLDFSYEPTKRQEKLGAQYLYIHEVTFSDVNTITDWPTLKRYSELYGEITGDLFAKKATRKKN